VSLEHVLYFYFNIEIPLKYMYGKINAPSGARGGGHFWLWRSVIRAQGWTVLHISSSQHILQTRGITIFIVHYTAHRDAVVGRVIVVMTPKLQAIKQSFHPVDLAMHEIKKTH
jgi:hypothetical protein